MSEEPTAEPTELAAEVRGTLSAELAGLCTEHGIDPAPALEWTWRMRRVLGRAYVGEHMIRLSVWLDEDQASDTLRHELAHIAAGVGRQAPHGERWQEDHVDPGMPDEEGGKVGRTGIEEAGGLPGEDA